MSLTARRVAAAAFLLSVSLPLFAADPAAPWNATPMTADPKDVLAAAEKVPAGDSDVVVLLEEDRYSFDADGHANIAEHIVYRVAAESAIDNWSTIETLWSPWLQEKPDVQARVIARDGTVHMLDSKSISESAAPESSLDIFSDNRVIRAPLPAVATGSVVEELITYKDQNPMYDSGINGRFYFGRFVPVQQARLVIDSPASVTPRIVNKTSPLVAPKTEEKDGRTTLTFEAGPIAAMPVDDFEFNLPYDESIRQYIGFSTGKSWKDLAARYSAIVDKQIAGSSSVAPIVKAATAGVSDRRQIISRLLDAIEKDVRYAGVEIGESSIIPRTPDKVLSLKYGDCKDKATLLVAMLREAHIPAHVALLRAGEDLDVSPDLPGLGEFNHAIVVVDGPTPLWVDPTDDFGRAGDLPPMDQGRQALIADPKTTALATVPMSDAKANVTIETRTFNLAEEGKSSVVETTEFRGGTESNARRFYAHRDKKQTRDTLEHYVKSEYLAESLKDYDFSDAHDLSKPFRVTVSATEAGRGVTDDGEAVVAMLPTTLTDNLSPSFRAGFEDDDRPPAKKPAKERKKRTHDFVFRMPYTRELIYRIVPPPGYAARTLPQNETVPIGSASLKQEFATNGDGAILATFTFDSGKRRLSPAEFEAMRTSLHDVLQRKPIVIGFDEIGETKLAAGDIGGALTEFRKLVALHPKEARHHTEIARTLLSGGMGDAAREEMKKAIEIEPSYARAHATYGIILEHDLFGRPYRKGFDMKTAVAELRKAKELDSQNVEFRVDLAKALEVGDDGSMFGRGARTDEAIAELKAIKADLKDDRFEGDLLSALANGAKFQEMKDLADSMKDPDQRMLGRIVAIAALQNAQDALREAGTVDHQQRQKLLEAAGNTLATLRLYPQAVEILEQAVAGSAKPSEMRQQIDLLRKAKRVDRAQLTDKDPAGVVMKLLASILVDDPTKATIGPLFASDLQPLLIDEATDEDTPVASLAGLRSPLDKQGAPVSFLMDLTFASIQTQQDGDDKGGWRVRLRSSGEHEITDTFYVVRENGAYRIAGARKLPEMIGWTALRFASAGDVESARRWLNWAREEISAGSADDPLAGAPFALLWPKAKQSATADEVKLAAATLMYRKPFSSRGIEILTQTRDKVTGDAQLYVDSALVTAYTAAHDYAKAEPIAKRLLAARPDSESAVETYGGVLSQLNRNAEVVKLAGDRLAKLPKDRTALRMLARAALVSGDYAKCDGYYRQIINEATPDAGDYNNVAWNALFLRRNLDRALEDARQATSLAPSPAALHTLAALYAETGKSLEARDALLRSMDEAGREEPASHDWYVLGRIAENYGARDAAIAAYKRVEQTKDMGSDSTYLLAKRRMEAMR